MSSRVGTYDEISQYIDRLRDERKITESTIRKLEQDKSAIDEKIEDLKLKRDALEMRLHGEIERAERQDRGLKEAESTYAKLIESQKSLADFVRKEYQDTKRK